MKLFVLQTLITSQVNQDEKFESPNSSNFPSLYKSLMAVSVSSSGVSWSGAWRYKILTLNGFQNDIDFISIWVANQSDSENYFESTPLSTFIFVKLVSNCLKTDSRPRPFPPHGFTFVAIGIFSFFHAGTFPEKVITWDFGLFWSETSFILDG